MVPEAIQYQFESDIGYAGVTQQEEVTVSKSVKCEFKSHHLYQISNRKEGSDDMVDYYYIEKKT